MGGDTLGQLSKKTSSSTEDLGSLVKQLAQAAAPLEGKFNGAGRAAFDKFHGQSNSIAAELNGALASVLQGITGQNKAFLQGDQQMMDETNSAQSGAGFESARFSSKS
jgi:uncharacterized protein YukE